MSNFRKTSGHSVVNTVRKTLTILGCLFFLFSFICPFCYARWSPVLSPLLDGQSWSTYNWSYEAAEHYVNALSQSYMSHYWFSDYWFSSMGFVDLGIPWILISLFAVQVLTLIFGVAFIMSNRRILSFEPIILSIAVAALMTYTGWVISGELEVLSSKFQLGYYLVYPAIGMFLLAFLLNEVTRRRQRTNRESLICTGTEDKLRVQE